MNFNEIRKHETGVNIPAYERILTTVLGLGGVVWGLREGIEDGDPIGYLVAGFGTLLAARGVSGRCAVTRQIARRARGSESGDELATGTGEMRAPTYVAGLGSPSSMRPQV